MSFDTYTTPDAEQLLLSARQRHERRQPRRLLLTESAAAAVFLLGAVLLAALGHSERAWSWSAVVVGVIAYIASYRVVFPVGSGSNRATQVVFVPLLFVLPIAAVPLVVLGCMLLDLSPSVLRREMSATHVLTRIADNMFALGPVCVLLAAHAQVFSWSNWPIYIGAFAAQVGVDIGAGLARTWFSERILPWQQLQMAWLYVMDACLSCVGLLLASSADRRPGLILLALPLILLLGLFAHERQERMDNTLALSTAYRGTALLLGDVIEDDDEYTGIHSRQVVDLSIAVADRLGLDASTKRNVEFGALLHDVGKIRIPKEIIHKQGKLSEEEWALMREHTVFGEQMLKQVGGTLSSVGKVVRHSHERFDGTGYPDGLSAEQIPIESRIVSACDAFNAMTTNRPYRDAMSVGEAIAELRRCSGTHFDPSVVDALLAALAARPATPEEARSRATLPSATLAI
jgi:HD-GYP domain-containing protein (c-di-GMP phosphodiesterase class II)